MKCVQITEYVWVTSDSKIFNRYNSARYHEIVLRLQKLIKKGN
jgi:hypothetical protein